MSEWVKSDYRRATAEQDALLDVQFAIMDILRDSGVSKEELARRLAVSKSRVSQLFSPDANLTIRQIARVYDALDRVFVPTSRSVGAGEKDAGCWMLGVDRLRESLQNVKPFTVVDHPANENYTEFGGPWDHVAMEAA
ncbi:hypothetical protein [Afifella sp. YEN Y35]|uniref:hypothetical protein n=1 Tax=Afifella sp. YEN Y35 TaxID=3388337 RepID=UPI0039E11FDB